MKIALRKVKSKGTDDGSSTTGLTAISLGGLALPLRMEVKALNILNVRPTATGLDLKCRMDSTVNAIPPWCGRVRGRVDLLGVTKPRLILPNFYCNWALIGNVATTLDLDVESVDVTRRTFSGRYTIRFVGTGNAFGSGLFTADVSPQRP